MKKILKCSLFCLLFFSQTVNGNEEKVNVPEGKQVEIINNEEKNTLEKVVEVDDISETAPSTEEKSKDASEPKINSENTQQSNDNQKSTPSTSYAPVNGGDAHQTSPVEGNISSNSEMQNYDESTHQSATVESDTSASSEADTSTSSEAQVGASAENLKPIEETKKRSDNISEEKSIKREEDNKTTIVLFKNLSLFKVVVLALVFSLTIIVAVLGMINNDKGLRKV